MIREWIDLLRLARRRLESDADYQRFQTYQGNLVVGYLAKQGIDFTDTLVLDLACGCGGYSSALTRRGARVISIDLRRPQSPPSVFVMANAIHLPFDSESFPFIFCASLVEHIPDPRQLLVQIRRVLSSDGLVYLSFPPFYSLVGGHQFKPYHLLGEQWAIRLSRHHVKGFSTAFGSWGLYPLTIRKLRRMVADAGLKIERESTRFLPFNLAGLPWIGEFLTWHVQFILSKVE